MTGSKLHTTHKGIIDMKKVILVAAVLASLPMLSFAETSDTSFGSNQAIGAKISTLGLGLDYSFTIAESVEGRVGFNYLNRDIDRTWSNNPASGNAKLATINMLADWFPANNSLRLTAGFMINNNKLDLSRTRTAGSSAISVTEYGHADFRKLSPYLGIGWTGKKKDQHLTAAFDLGVLFQGNPRTSVTSSLAPSTALPGAGCGATVAACLASDNAALYDDIRKYRLWPVASMTVSYGF